VAKSTPKTKRFGTADSSVVRQVGLLFSATYASVYIRRVFRAKRGAVISFCHCRDLIVLPLTMRVYIGCCFPPKLVSRLRIRWRRWAPGNNFPQKCGPLGNLSNTAVPPSLDFRRVSRCRDGHNVERLSIHTFGWHPPRSSDKDDFRRSVKSSHFLFFYVSARATKRL
jgi:hypothetical protein